MNVLRKNLIAALVAALFATLGVEAFAPISVVHGSRIVNQYSSTTTAANPQYFPPALQRQRKSVANVQTMGLFGLGAPEIAIILVAAAFLLGPQKLAELGKDAGKIAGELKEVPKEFQKGLEEGEQQALSLKAKNEEEKKES